MVDRRGKAMTICSRVGKLLKLGRHTKFFVSVCVRPLDIL